MASYPKRIVCLTEEPVETLFLLGKESLIVGVSAYAVRPVAAKKLKRVSAFTSANIEKILELSPDLVIGYSDIQKDIASELIGRGVNVFIANHRSLSETLNYIELIGRIVDAGDKAKKLTDSYRERLEHFSRKTKVRTYIEEWDDPLISGIQYFSELAGHCGFENIFNSGPESSLAKDRIYSHEQVIEKDPQVIFACHCGKKVNLDEISKRVGYSEVEAIKKKQVFELSPEVFLQPGPALFEDGLKILSSLHDELTLS